METWICQRIIYILQDEFESIITEAMQFISGPEFTLTQGLPQEKLAALQQCIEKIHINMPGNEAKILIRRSQVRVLAGVLSFYQ